MPIQGKKPSAQQIEQIYQLLEDSSSKKVIIGLNKLRQHKLDYKIISYLVGMSWFYPDTKIRRRIKHLIFKEVSDDYASFLKGKWRYLPTPTLPKVWNLIEEVVKHPQIDAGIIRQWAYREHLTNPELKLNNLKLQYLSSELATFKHLKVLDLANNHLLTLPPEFGKLKKLETLFLAHNQIAVLPTEIRKLKSLKKLDLSANQGMNNLPSDLSNWAKLIWLDLSYNSFKTLPLGICNLPKLKELNIAHNQIKQLPKAAKQLKKLKKLNWSANELPALPIESLLLLENLTTLDISDNLLEELPLKLKKLPCLKQITIHNIPALAKQRHQLKKNFAPIELIF
ncbi:leucine-rich repeat domain-containing protein [uncultured Microscilla sp.]|uniref:leucine-rich repeat domain-containing protein n=1 Tax=uncultured Microscilla sp. TaxID=432653 RepID=UPI002634AD3D|nr:leucine-rich repeat domain-containing protein [uncultured Microscilla sp.]